MIALDEQRAKILNEKYFKSLTVTKESINQESRTVNLAFASEVPYARWYGIEILGCKPEEVRMTRLTDGAPLLNQHNSDEQIGVVEVATVDPDKVCRATVRFSKSEDADEIFQDVVDGIRKKVSVGYMVHDMEELKPEQMTEEIKKMALDLSLPVFRVTQWEPYEISSVSIPADNTVGVGRSMDAQPQITLKQEATMPEEIKTPAPVENPEKLEAERKQEINAIAEKYSDRYPGGKSAIGKRAKDAIDCRITAEQFRGEVYMALKEDGNLPMPDTFLGLSEKELKKYRFNNVILAQMPDIGKLRDVNGKQIDVSFEREVSDTISSRIGAPQHGGLHVPFDIQTRTTGLMDVTNATQGGNLVGTNLLGSSFIDYLRNKMVALQLGAQELTGLVGNVAIPRQTGDPTFYYVAEDVATTTSNATIGQLSLTPKTGGGFTDITRQLLLQSTPSADTIAMQSLAKVCRIAIDKAFFHGTGTTQPTGIAGTSSIGSVSGANFGWDQAVEFESDVADANADVATMSYVCSPVTRGILKTRPRGVLSQAMQYLCENNQMNGYPVVVSKQITDSYVFFGDFSQAMLAYWGGLDILVDPYTNSTKGTVRVTAFVTFDVGVIHAGSFSVCSDLT